MTRWFGLWLLMLMFFFSAAAQQFPGGGIKWTNGLSWQEVKEKARKENKYIFLDCFATWCGPCKQMDRSVYVNDTVGSFINERFIAVKVQMDKTKNDNEEVKNWYADARAIQDQYRVMAFPTYIFLSPQGQVVYIDKGFQRVEKFIATAATAVQPGQVYVDKYEEFNRLEEEYKAGKKNYNRMLYMIRVSQELGQVELFKQLHSDYMAHLKSVKKRQVYTKENIEYLGSLSWSSTAQLFKVFYPNGKKADKAIGFKGYADNVVSRTIVREIAVPFLGVQASFNMLGGKRDTAEADWAGLYKKLTAKFPQKYVDRAFLEAKIMWYEQRFNYPLLAQFYLEKLDKYGLDTVSAKSNTTYTLVNHYCWQFFLRINDQGVLERAANHMEKAVKARPDFQAYDTYANLLYKAGKKTEAIYWEERALGLVKEKQITDQGNRYFAAKVNNFAAVLSKMRSDKPTWPVKK
ncbi:DUF255 domain-containing protein [Pseudoflavitalea sp. X16]|uniref:DUF255 domain-containing protein n=1 Tax=Paraflavitalea devenefica TaxID=2716334 RepID=UPI00141DB1EC|nr:DUF255 domain-containing protein [Paraflavitalea devenefica]NII27766.1 DUF255 domain-containing protein [Paraflavitalea devenefica]